ncbi:WD40 repeat domain-containing protein [Bradyrhizobium prioriisuperbiae]|uniref:WD40 repeat domain-containing protein n=1 Tax=Bradyrhizobium prioriisuperbiae TaxID=2854389 RepID=UPI0028F08189|nr:WD40 repeat domain-containing protein [Bradyrhizobium prioritasuperba]
MTDVTPRTSGPRWAELIGITLAHLRINATFAVMIVKRAPILTAGVVGLLGGLWIAQWSQQWIADSAPLAARTPGTRLAAMSGMHWFANDTAVVFMDDRRASTFVQPSGTIPSSSAFVGSAPLPLAPILTGARAELAASIAQPADDGALVARTTSFELVIPGGLAVVDDDGALYVTGATRLRNPDRSNERGIVAIAPDPRTVWRTSASNAQSQPDQARQPVRFEPALPWDTTVTAMIALPSPGRIAVGGIDGRIAFIREDRTPIVSAEQTAARKGAGSHGAAVVALATAGAWSLDESRAQLASAASDGSIKAWYPARSSGAIVSQDILFPEGTPPPLLAPDSLEMSDDGRLLTVRTSNGDIYVARLERRGLTGPAAALPSPSMTMVRLPLDVEATASALSSRLGTRLYVAAQDCSIREIDLGNVAMFAGSSSLATRIPSISVTSTLWGHGGPISRLAVSHNEQYLAAASLDGRVRIHHLSSLRRVAALPFADLPTGPGCASTAALPLPSPRTTPPTEQVTPQQAPQLTMLPAGPNVTIRFAGSIERPVMVQFADSLLQTGWNIQGADQGGEQRPEAANVNEVRFGPRGDGALAERLAAVASSARSAGIPGRPLRAVMVKTIENTDLEIWISR